MAPVGAAPAGDLVRRRTGWTGFDALLVGAAFVVVLVGLGILAGLLPLVGVAVALAVAFGSFPGLSRGVLIGIACVAPTFNPPVLGIGAGRLYLAQALIVAVVGGGLALALRNGMAAPALGLVALSTLLVATQTFGRPNAGPAWVYRPLQVFLVAFAVRSLFRNRSDRRLVLALAWGSTVGCLLASVHAVLPGIDPFAWSRPRDLPFVSAIGSYERATGAFTYPNNLGTFAAYAVLLGASAWLLGRPGLPRPLAVALMVSGGSALTLAGSRAAGLGLLCGLLYLSAKATLRRRVAIITAEVVFGLLVVAVVLSSPTAIEVLSQRARSATGESFFGRLAAFEEPIQAFLRSPLIGTGASELNLDNFVVLYVVTAGILGALLLSGVAGVALHTSAAKRYPELWVALLLAMATSGMLQDSLGQTLVTWFLGALLGVSMLPRPAGDGEQPDEVRPAVDTAPVHPVHR